MSRRGDNIRRRKDGRWEGRIRIGRSSEGKTRYRSLYGSSYKEVRDKMRASETALQTGMTSASVRTLEELLTLWFQNGQIRRKGATNLKYGYMLSRHIIPCIGKWKLSAVTSHEINTFLEAKSRCGRLDGKGGLSPSYVKTMALILQAALNFGKAEKLCPDTAVTVMKPEPVRKELRILSRQEQQRLEAYLKTDTDAAGSGTMLSLYTGLRIGEVCALSWNDIDLDNAVIHVRHTVSRIREPGENPSAKLIIDTPKTKASFRDIPIPSVLKTFLSLLKGEDASGYLLSDSGHYLNPRTLDYRYHKMLTKCGIESLNYHALRHTFATRCIEAGMDIKTLSEILGHSNAAITLNTYVHSSMERKREQIEKLCSPAL